MLNVHDRGSGPAVVLLPSLGRGAADFDDLGGRLVDVGYRAVAFDPPEALFPGAGMADVAALVLERLDDLGIEQCHLIGHAFGNRWARAFTAANPARVLSLTLLAAGGLVEPEPDVHLSLISLFDLDAPEAERLAHIDKVFFAEGHDASIWLDGWFPIAAAIEGEATTNTPIEEWWAAAPDRVLVVQGLQDVCAVPENGRRYVADLTEAGTDARLVEVEPAGHALLPEQPEAIAAAVLDFLAGSD
jgi:pimeloyl-ACP methyl ester carboxylesterase